MTKKMIGSYRLIRELGRGGMAIVYEGEHMLMGRRAAIKVLHTGISNREQVVKRFFNEARVVSSIKHPGIVEVYDFGYHESRAFLVMELLRGETLRTRLKRDKVIAPGEAVRLSIAIADALAAAHEVGVVHRDLKPANVFLRDGTEICLLDFGVAKLTGTESWAGTNTGSDVIIGTPTYMAPEQCRGSGAVDVRADQYALGCLLYTMLTGRPPFSGVGGGELIARHLFEPPKRLRKIASALPDSLDTVVMRLLEKKPDDRYETIQAVADALTALLDDVAGIPSVDFEAVRAQSESDTTISRASAEVGEQSVPSAQPAKDSQRRRLGLLAAGVGVAVFASVMALRSSGTGVGDGPASAALGEAAATRDDDAHRGQLAGKADSRNAASNDHAAGGPRDAGADADAATAINANAPAPATAGPIHETVVEAATTGIRSSKPVNSDSSPATARVALEISSRPSGAEVRDEQGKKLGKTPMKLFLGAREAPWRLEVHRPGYKRKQINLPGDRSTSVEVKLKRR